MSAEPVPIKLRGKYRQQPSVKNNQYKARTGPHCCNGGCGRRVRGVSWRKNTGGGSTARSGVRS